ncbi:hypothetical protein [Hyunsoonleella rubra]|uniref:Host attachment protein n=1 Tax=Hyunsoonleella rubra TaxID=1737062 RepID=A0ABW5T6G6_9FLAO
MKTGVWLDKAKAHIVNLYDGKESFTTILSNVEDFKIHGGSGTKFKGGPQDVVQDSKYLEREKHQLKKYFDNIVSEIKKARVIVIFGPAEACYKLDKRLKNHYPDLSKKVKGVYKTDSMTKPQVKAWAKSFFKEKRL